MSNVMRRSLIAGLLGSGLILRFRRLTAQERQAAEEGARKEGAFGLATSVSAASFPTFMDAFKAKYSFLDVTSGYYSAPTGRVLARLNAEMDAGNLSFDALHVANLAPYLAMARKGQLQPYHSPELAAFPDGAHGGDLWTSARVIGVIMAYNKNVLAPDQAPQAWVDMLVRGEALVGATVDHFRAFEPDAMKAGIVGVYPSEGMPVALAPVAMLKGAPHPNAARLFIDFTLSRAGNTLLAHDIFNVYSPRADVPTPDRQLPYAETKPLLPQDLADYEQASAKFPEHFDSFFKA